MNKGYNMMGLPVGVSVEGQDPYIGEGYKHHNGLMHRSEMGKIGSKAKLGGGAAVEATVLLPPHRAAGATPPPFSFPFPFSLLSVTLSVPVSASVSVHYYSVVGGTADD